MLKRLSLFLFALLFAANAHAAVRIALVGSGPEKDTAGLLALAEVKLSEDNRIELLERTQIHKVLDEQKLSLSGMVDENQAVAAGKLLRVEVFAVVQSLGPDAPPVLTVFDAFNGSRLVDVDLPKDDVGQQVGAIVRGIDRSRQKLAAPLHAKTVCLLAVRNADLPRTMDPMCNAVGSLLERQLLTSDDIRLLERKRLEGINKERQLGTLDPKHDILASLVTIDLEFSRAKEGDQPTVTALLSDGAGKSIAKPSTTVDPKHPAEAVSQLGSKIAQALEVVPGQAGLEPAKEGRRFLVEAEFLLAHGDVERGLQSAESAFALAPESPVAIKLLSFALMRRAIDIQRSDQQQLSAALDMAARAMDLRDAELMNLNHTDLKHHDLKLFPDNLTGDWIMALLQTALKSDDAKVTEASRRLGDSYVHFAHDWIVNSEALSAGNEHDLAEHQSFIRLNRIVPALALASASKADYVAEVTGIYERYFSLLSKMPAMKSIRLYVIAGQELGDPAYWTCPDRKWSPADFAKDDLARIDHVYQMLADHPSSAVRFYGLRDRLQFLRSANRMSDEEFATAYVQARDAARAGLDDDVLTKVDRVGMLRNAMIGNAMTIVGQGKDPQQWLSDRIGWYDFFNAHHVLPQQALVHVGDLVRLQASGEDAVKVLRGLQTLVDDSQTQFIGCSAVEGRTQLAKAIRSLAGNYAEVREAFLNGESVARLLLKAGDDITSIQYVISDGKGGAFAIVAARDPDEPSLRAVSLALDGSGGRTIGSIALATSVNDACVTDTQIVVATDAGIVIFARTGGNTAKITTDDGLPTNSVQSVAMMGDVIYAGLRDHGYLVSYDIGSRKCTVLASSRRKEKASPFDDAGNFAIVRIAADVAKQRLLLVHCHSGRFAENGLWRYEPATAEFKQLLPVYFDYGQRNAAATRILPDGRMLINSYNWAIAFDTKTDTPTLLFADSIGASPTLRTKSRPFEFNRRLAAPYTLVADELWSASPLSRIEPNTNRMTEIDLPDDEPATAPSNRRAREKKMSWLEPLADAENVVVGDAQSLWLVPIKSRAATSAPSSQPKP